MRRNKRGRRRQLARPLAYKQAGAVEEALRRRGVTAHVNPSWNGRSLLVQVADPDAHMGYLDAHADALADALLVDAVSISSGLCDFIVAPEWRGLDDSAEGEEEVVWSSVDSTERPPNEPTAPDVASASANSVDTLEAFIHGYNMGRLAGVLGDLRRSLTLGGPAVTAASSCALMQAAIALPSGRNCCISLPHTCTVRWLRRRSAGAQRPWASIPAASGA